MLLKDKAGPLRRCDGCGAPLEPDDRQGLCVQCLVLGLFAPDGLDAESLPMDDESDVAAATRGLADYEILAEVARGGMGVVYRARQRSLGRTVALKMVHPGHASAPGARQRFQLEAEAAAQLDHPHIVPVYEVGESDGRPFLSMKLIDTGSLADQLAQFTLPTTTAQGGPPRLVRSQQRLAKLMAAVASAVDHAHQHGILHRDLKPSNILIDADGQPLVTDFGLAKRMDKDHQLTGTEALLGSPAYLAPEVAQGGAREAGIASDVYGLGAVMYHVLTGQPPHQGETALQVVMKVAHGHPKHPSALNPLVDRDLATICLKCMDTNPARRYASARELADELQRYCRGEPIQARPLSGLERAWRFCHRRPLVSALVALTLLTALGAVAGIAWQWSLAQQAYQRAELNSEHLAKAVASLSREQAKLRTANQQLSDQATRHVVDQAERLMEEGDASAAVAYLAGLLRDTPAHRPVFRRAVSAIESGRFAVLAGKTEAHDGTVLALDVASDGRRFVTAANDGIARVWSLETGEPMSPPLRHGGPVADAVFCPEGSWLVTASFDGTARLWDSRNGAPRGAPMTHGRAALVARFDPTGRYIVTGSKDTTARIWDAVSGEPLGDPMRHSSYVHQVAFWPTGGEVLTATVQGSAPSWSLPSGQPAGELTGNAEYIGSIRFGPLGKTFVRAVSNAVEVWDVQTRRLRCLLRHEGLVLWVDYAPDGQQLVTGTDDNRVSLWELREKDAERVRTWPRVGPVVHFSPRGDWIATMRERSAVVFDASTGRRVFSDIHHPLSVRHVRFTADGKRLITVCEDHIVRIWDLEPIERKRQGQSLGTIGRLREIRHSPDGNRIVAKFKVDTRDRLCTWSFDGTSVVEPASVEKDAFASRFTSDGHFWCLAFDGEQLRLRRDGQVKRSWPMREVKPTWGWLGPEARRMVLLVRSPAEHNQLRFWAAESGWRRPDSSQHFEIDTIAQVDPCGRTIALVTDKRGLWVHEAEDGHPRYPAIHQPSVIRDMRFDGTGERIVTASADGLARVWDTATGRLMGETMVHNGAVTQATFGPADLLLTGSEDGTARLWDLSTGKLRIAPLVHDAAVLSAEISPDGRTLATLTDEGVARLWDAATGLPVAILPPELGSLIRVVFSPDGHSLLTASRSGAIHLWPISPHASADALPPAWFPDLAEAIAGLRVSDGDTVEWLPWEDRRAIFEEIAAMDDPDDTWLDWARPWIAAATESSPRFED